MGAMTIIKDSIRGFNLFNKNILLFLGIALISAVISFYLIPSFISGSITESDINQELNSLGAGGMFSSTQVIQSMVSTLQFLIISTILLVIAYVAKYLIDKRLFDVKRWRDWKFFLYVSGVTYLEMYILGNVFSASVNSFIGTIALMVLYSFVTVIASAILLPEEAYIIKNE